MAVKYSAEDKDMFLQILSNYPIIEDKRADARTISKKKAAWDQIVVEYNAVANDTRTVVQLKRLWDKTKRIQKSVLPEERCELMATSATPSPQPEIDNILPHLKFEVESDADSDGIYLQESNDGSAASVVPKESPRPSSACDVKPLSASPTIDKAYTIQKQNKNPQKNHLSALTQARLKLIKKEEAQMEELHKVRMEEAEYKREAARLIMLQEEAKLIKIKNS